MLPLLMHRSASLAFQNSCSNDDKQLMRHVFKSSKKEKNNWVLFLNHREHAGAYEHS